MDSLDLDRSGELPPEFLRLGIEFPDGASLTNLEALGPRSSPDATQPLHGMEPGSGSGTDADYEQEWWVWPIPGPGELWFVCEWPAYGVGETRFALDAGLIRDAAVRAQPIWPDLQGPSHVTSAMFEDDPDG